MSLRRFVCSSRHAYLGAGKGRSAALIWSVESATTADFPSWYSNSIRIAEQFLSGFADEVVTAIPQRKDAEARPMLAIEAAHLAASSFCSRAFWLAAALEQALASKTTPSSARSRPTSPD